MSNQVGLKYDQDKVRLDLIPTEALIQIGKVLTFGAAKYSPNNWRHGISWSRVLGAAMRHILAFNNGEDKDPETGISHLAHAGCCIFFLLTYEKDNVAFDDRYKKALSSIMDGNDNKGADNGISSSK